MREMIFNDASVTPPARSMHDVAPLLQDMAKGMAALVNSACVETALRMKHSMFEVPCAADGSLHQAALFLRTLDRDAAVFLQRLAQKAPLLEDLPAAAAKRLLGCQATSVEAGVGEALVLCALVDGIAVSVPLAALYDTHRLSLTFEEIEQDGDFVRREQEVDNVGRASHAQEILARARVGARGSASRESFWECKDNVFPSLKFGLDVEQQVLRLDAALFGVALTKLEALHASAIAWRNVGGAAPPWTCKVTGESATTMADRRLVAARTFRDANGAARIYEWHARMGNGGRIHVYFDAQTRDIEIGYIGWHLPI